MAQETDRGAPTVWAGWVICAVAVMAIVGVWHVATGLVALLSEGTFVVGRDRLVVPVGYAAWGWLHIFLGVVVVVAAVGLLVGRGWARVLAVVAALASAVVNVGFLAAAPGTSAVLVGFDVLVIYAVTVHGGELRGVYAPTDPDAARYAR